MEEDLIEKIIKLAIDPIKMENRMQMAMQMATLWQNIPLEVQRESIIEVIKTLVTNEKAESTYIGLCVRNVWQYTLPEVQREMLSKILKFFTSIKYNDISNKELSPTRFLVFFLKATSQEIIKDHYEEICEIALSFEDKDNDLSRTLIYSIPSFKDLDEKTIKRINDGNLIARVSLEYLEQIKDKISKDVPIYLEIEDVSELSIEKIEELTNEGINLLYVGMKSKAKRRLEEEVKIPHIT